jgi:hypothetical protein
MEEPVISYIKFTPCQRNGSLIGFVDFIYAKIQIQGAGVHSLLDSPDQYRLVYPNNLTDGRYAVFPTSRDINKYIDEKITQYVNQQLTKGVKDETSHRRRHKSISNGNKN